MSVNKYLSINGIKQWIRDKYHIDDLRQVTEHTYSNRNPPYYTSNISDILRYRRVYQPNRTVKETLTYLIDNVTTKYVKVFNEIGLDRYTDSIDGFIDFLYYYIYGNVGDLNIPYEIKSYVSGLSVSQLMEILSSFRNGLSLQRLSQRKSILTYNVLTGSFGKGQLSITIEDNRYKKIKSLPPDIVWKLALAYEIERSISFLGPYEYVASKRVAMEDYLIYILQNNDNSSVLKIFDILQLLPFNEDPNISGNTDIVTSYILSIVKWIDPVLTRPNELNDPPEIFGMDDEEALITLTKYTDKELERFYDMSGISFFSDSRDDRIEDIIKQSRKGLRWTRSHKICSNGDLLEIIDIAPRYSIINDKKNKEYRDKIWLSYGTPRNHACYSIDELIESFRVDSEDNLFHFHNPDGSSDFNIYSMKLLSSYLKELIGMMVTNRRASMKQLVSIIDNGIISIRQSNKRIEKYAMDYQSMTPDEQNLVLQYFAWLFVFGMYNRYWKGPPNEYPNLFNYNPDDKCTQEQRELVSQFAAEPLFNDILKKARGYLLNNSSSLYDWIINLPRIRYDWSSNDYYISLSGQETETTDIANRNDLIYSMIIKTLQGNYCESALSDIAIQSSYAYLTKAIKLSLQQFNQLIRQYLKDNRQPDFIPSQFKATGHELALEETGEDVI